MKPLLRLAVSTLVLTAVPCLSAQDYDLTQDRLLVGEIRVQGGAVPPGRALVQLYNSLNAFITQTSTTSSGGYSFQGVGASDLILIVKCAGYEDATARITVFPNMKITHVPPIVLTPLSDPSKQPTSGVLDAAVTKLKPEARQHLEKGLKAVDQGRMSAARDHFLRTLELEPQFAPAHYYLGLVQSQLSEYPQAQASFEDAVRLNPHAADYYFGLGRVMNLQGKPEEGLIALDKGLAILPHASLGLFEKSRAQFLLKRYPESEAAALQALTETPPPPPEVHLLLANDYIRLQRFPEAESELERYLSLVPDSPSAGKAKEVLAKLRASTNHKPTEIAKP
jgi:tetratricopeptide (TPR) repeat protein